jgi:hypothetical protein
MLPKTDQFQFEFPLLFSVRLLVKKSSRFLEIFTIFVLCLNLLKCQMQEKIWSYVLIHTPENNPL